jgi:hypothetical protein
MFSQKQQHCNVCVYPYVDYFSTRRELNSPPSDSGSDSMMMALSRKCREKVIQEPILRLLSLQLQRQRCRRLERLYAEKNNFC